MGCEGSKFKRQEMSWVRRLFWLGSRAKMVGTDLAGNQYFEKTIEGKL